MGQTFRTGFYIRKLMKLRKMGHTLWSHLEKRVTLIKMGHSGRKWVTIEKIGHTWKTGSQLQNRFALGKMGHT